MVCLDTPYSRARSSTARPASSCFSAAMICASLCLLLLIRFPLSFVRNRTPSRTVYGGHVTIRSELNAVIIKRVIVRRLCSPPAHNVWTLRLDTEPVTAIVHLQSRQEK